MWLYVKYAQRGNHKKGKGVVGESGKEKLDKLQEHALGGDSWDKMLRSSSGITGLQGITWMLQQSHDKGNPSRRLWSVLAPNKTLNGLVCGSVLLIASGVGHEAAV